MLGFPKWETVGANGDSLGNNKGTPELRTCQGSSQGSVASLWMGGCFYSTSTTAFTPYPQKATVIYRLYWPRVAVLSFGSCFCMMCERDIEGSLELASSSCVSFISISSFSFVTGLWWEEEREGT